MKPAFQTQFAKPDGTGYGNCAAACLASILEIPLSEVPDFFAPDVGLFNDAISKFIESQGRKSIYVQFDHVPDDEEPVVDSLFFWPTATSLAMISGVSPRSKNKGVDAELYHAVVGKPSGYRIDYIHDPHPDGTFIAGKPTAIRWIF